MVNLEGLLLGVGCRKAFGVRGGDGGMFHARELGGDLAVCFPRAPFLFACFLFAMVRCGFDYFRVVRSVCLICFI